jgi:hypothetical protein
MRLFYSLLVILGLTGCAQQEEVKPVPYKLTGDVKHIMQWVLDPAADLLWDSAGSIITAEGTEELAPTTEEGWLAVQHSAVVVAESANLLILPGRARDDQDWREISLAMVDVGMRAKAAAEAKDADALFDIGGELYRVCVSCHSQYIQGDEKQDPIGD